MEGKGKGVIRTCHEPGEESIEDGKGFEVGESLSLVLRAN